MKRLLIATTDEGAVSSIRECLGNEYEVETTLDRASCLARFMERRHEFAFIDLSFLLDGETREKEDYGEALAPYWNAFPTAHIIVMASQPEIRRAVNLVKAGATDYLTYPISPAEVSLVTETTAESIRAQSELEYLRDRFWKSESEKVVHTLNPVMKKVFDKIKSVAPTRSTVLLTGETGTGKSVLAKIIHLHSNRSNDQFISVHCGAIPETLVESELFGHEKGAFTGAIKRKLGKFEIAQGGTIFLDEVSTVTKPVQIRLLQVLQEKTFARVGGEVEIKADVRVIAASNEDLETLIEDGGFRKDLYYRLNVFPIAIPPLRERIEDLPFLVQSILHELDKYNTKNINAVHPQVMEAFRNYDWPGNIRELENLIERAYIIERSNILSPESFPSELFGSMKPGTRISPDLSGTLAQARAEAVQLVEIQYLKELLAVNNGRMDQTAKSAGIGTRQLHKLMTKYEIKKEDYKTRKGDTNKPEP